MNSPNPETSTKTFRKTTYSTFASTAELLALTPRELVNSLGYTDSTASTWEKNNEIPYVAGLACEALLAKAAKAEPAAILLVQPTPAQSTLLHGVLSAMGIKFSLLEI